ncbi:hypothetical protein D9M71_796320 [compost metagenome]
MWCQRDQQGPPHFHAGSGDFPNGFVHIELAPFGLQKLIGTDENHCYQLKRQHDPTVASDLVVGRYFPDQFGELLL